jgi:hypothetical protein
MKGFFKRHFDFWIRIVVVLSIALIIAAGFWGTSLFTNKQMFDTTWSFDYACIAMPDGSSVDGKIESWTDFEDGDQVQIKIDGVTYLTHIENVVLLSN